MPFWKRKTSPSDSNVMSHLQGLESHERQADSRRALESLPSSDTRRWGLALGAMLPTVHDDSICSELDWGDVRNAINLLRNSWNVESGTDLAGTLEGLWSIGHSSTCQQSCAAARKGVAHSGILEDFVQANLEKLERHFILGWDLGRIINVVRWGFTADYIHGQAAWQWIERTALRVQDEFNSWAAFGRDYQLGYQFWQCSIQNPPGDLARQLDWLVTSSDSPWTRIPWDIRLQGVER